MCGTCIRKVARPIQAAIEAADEIGLAVVATTTTILAVFVPVAFMPGIPGKIFAAFAIATCVSVAFSLLVARMLTPLMAAYFVRAGEHEDKTPFWLPAYLAILRFVLHRRLATLVVGVLLFAGSDGARHEIAVRFHAGQRQGSQPRHGNVAAGFDACSDRRRRSWP